MIDLRELKQRDFFDRKAKHYETDSDNSWVLLDGLSSFLDFISLDLPQNILELGYSYWQMDNASLEAWPLSCCR